ncbi:Y-family DNA polymerase [Celerinatantimonas yamalensis]|uniref:DNA polymerase Y family protein n=1 Tax=Celerinatantimonas yamalensis TaxID=559956 RepID=A0ABW9G3D4_9GAMM
MYWLYLDLPCVALDLMQRNHSRHQPLAIIAQQRIVQANQSAQQLGIKLGQSVLNAQQIVSSLQIAPISEAEIDACLHSLAEQLLELTPKVSIIKQQGLLVCSDAMDAIYPTIQQHLRTLILYIRSQALQSDGVAAMTAPLAIWLGQLRRRQPQHPRILLRIENGDLPIWASALPKPMITHLADMGLATLGQLLQLPRADLRARFGRELLDYIDSCLGKHQITYQWQTASAQFSRKMMLNYEATATTHLHHPCERLIQTFAHYLQTNQFTCQQLNLELHYRQSPSETVLIQSIQYQHQAQAWLMLVQLRLEAIQLVEPVIAMTLTSGICRAQQSKNYDIWQQTSPQNDAALLNQLTQRLGNAAVYRLRHGDDHQPERASILKNLDESSDEPLPEQLPKRTRPIWLLPQPLAITSMQFECLDTPELIELDHQEHRCVRCYQRIRFHDTQAQGWAFYDPLSTPAGWWLHGWFA